MIKFPVIIILDFKIKKKLLFMSPVLSKLAFGDKFVFCLSVSHSLLVDTFYVKTTKGGIYVPLTLKM